jgi:hypothetical protein
VPQARISTPFVPRSVRSAPAPNSAGVIDSMPSSVSATAAGCSKISFCM